MSGQGVPRRLYKYRDFSNRTLSMLIDDIVYFADPTTFNDPLDTKPALAADIDNAALEIILARLIEDRTVAEMSTAAKAIRYRGPRTLDHIARHGRKAAERALADLRYNATDPEYEIEDPQRFLLGYYVQEELLRRYDKGVFSLAARAICPLMWSHYGDQASVLDTTRFAGRFESEGRSHAFNSLVEENGSGLLGLPTVLRRGRAMRYVWNSEGSDVSFLTMSPSGKLGNGGALEQSATRPAPGYRCEVSCIDWYGNSRPIFTGGRIFALMATELAEGRMGKHRIEEVARLNLTETPGRRAGW